MLTLSYLFRETNFVKMFAAVSSIFITHTKIFKKRSSINFFFYSERTRKYVWFGKQRNGKKKEFKNILKDQAENFCILIFY